MAVWSVSWDRSDSWFQFRNLPISQFYEISVDMRDPYHVCGGLQDNGSWCAPSDTWSNQGIRTRDWYNVGSGDGFFTVAHPTDPHIMFAQSQGGNLTRIDLKTMERSRVRPIGRPGPDGEDPDLRWNWDTPILQSAHDGNTIYFGSNVLFKSSDLGQNWQAISEDLTPRDRPRRTRAHGCARLRSSDVGERRPVELWQPDCIGRVPHRCECAVYGC